VPREVRPRPEVTLCPIDAARVEISITPFLERPSLEVALLGPGGDPVTMVSVVETDTPRLSLTLHLRSEPEPGEYAVRSSLYFESDPPQDVRQQAFRLPEADAASAGGG
jgi:hypothetical protein